MAATSTRVLGRVRAVGRRSTFGVLLALGLLLGSAQAQQPPLEGLLPASTVVALHAAPNSGDLSALAEIFDAVGAGAGRDTLMRMLGVFGADWVEFADGADLDIVAMLLDDLGPMCPAAEAVWDAEAAPGLMGPSVLAVSLSPFSPLPGVLALARPADVAYAARVQDVLIECFANGPSLEQDGVTLHILADGGDLPLVVARRDGTFMAATDPDLLRGAIRLAGGSSEPSHLERPIGRAASTIMDGGLGVTLDFGALADGLSTLTGLLSTDPSDQLLFDRALQTLTSLGGAAGRITLDREGLRLDGLMTPDPAGGDAQLAALLACADCPAGTSPLLPVGAAAISGRYLDVQQVVSWIDDLLAAFAPLTGQVLDLRSVADEFLGVDLDLLLLDWVGNRWHSAQVGVLGTDVRTWISGPGTITTVGVTSEAAAREALGAWRALLTSDAGFGSLLDELMFLVDPFGAASGPAFPDGGLLAAREVEYRGISFERWRIGPTTDVGLAVLDGHLLIGMPASALRGAIDVHLGAPDASTDATLGPTLARLPADASAYSVTDVARQLRALAEVGDLLAAPLASAMALAIAEELSAASPWDDPWGGWGDPSPGAESGLWRSATRYGSDVVQAVGAALPLAVPGGLEATISEDDVLPNGDYGLVVTLEGLIDGALVMVEMTDLERSWDMDTYLYLYDLTSGAIIADDDDSPDTNRSELVFTVAGGVRYAVIASSWGGNDVGPIAVRAEYLELPEGSAAAPSDPVDEPPSAAEVDEAPIAPSFAELVAMFDVGADALRALAERVDLAVAVTVVEDGVVRTTVTLPIR